MPGTSSVARAIESNKAQIISSRFSKMSRGEQLRKLATASPSEMELSMKRAQSEPWCFTTQNGSHGPAASALSVKRLEMQNLGPILDILWLK